MYKFERAERICEEIDVGGEVIKVEFDVGRMARRFNAAQADILEVQSKVANSTGKVDTSIIEDYGRAAVTLFTVVFGEENTKKILDFYEGNEVEMVEVVFPWIADVFMPKFKKSAEAMRKKRAKGYLKG